MTPAAVEALRDAGVLADDVRGTFHPARFALARLPPRAGLLPGPLDDLPCCLDMLVKLPGGAITLPAPYASSGTLASLLAIAEAYEDGLLPAWRDTRFLYLTIDRRRVEPGRTHRNAGWHFDGMQGARYREKLPACHQYVVADAIPTQFSGAGVDAGGLDELRDDWFEALGAQLDGRGPVWAPEPLEVLCMSAYRLHRSTLATAPVTRTFIRLDVSCKEQDRLGNTLNPALPAPFAFKERRLPEGLGKPVHDSGWAGAVRFQGS